MENLEGQPRIRKMVLKREKERGRKHEKKRARMKENVNGKKWMRNNYSKRDKEI